MAAEAQVLGDDSMLSKSFTCAFASKATGTLSKRAFSLARFSTWMLEVEKESPLRASEGKMECDSRWGCIWGHLLFVLMPVHAGQMFRECGEYGWEV